MPRQKVKITAPEDVRCPYLDGQRRRERQLRSMEHAKTLAASFRSVSPKHTTVNPDCPLYSTLEANILTLLSSPEPPPTCPTILHPSSLKIQILQHIIIPAPSKLSPVPTPQLSPVPPLLSPLPNSSPATDRLSPQWFATKLADYVHRHPLPNTWPDEVVTALTALRPAFKPRRRHQVWLTTSNGESFRVSLPKKNNK